MVGLGGPEAALSCAQILNDQLTYSTVQAHLVQKFNPREAHRLTTLLTHKGIINDRLITSQDQKPKAEAFYCSLQVIHRCS